MFTAAWIRCDPATTRSESEEFAKAYITEDMIGRVEIAARRENGRVRSSDPQPPEAVASHARMPCHMPGVPAPEEIPRVAKVLPFVCESIIGRSAGVRARELIYSQMVSTA